MLTHEHAQCLCDIRLTDVLYVESCERTGYQLQYHRNGALDSGRDRNGNHCQLPPRPAKVFPTRWSQSVPSILGRIQVFTIYGVCEYGETSETLFDVSYDTYSYAAPDGQRTGYSE